MTDVLRHVEAVEHRILEVEHRILRLEQGIASRIDANDQGGTDIA